MVLEEWTTANQRISDANQLLQEVQQKTNTVFSWLLEQTQEGREKKHIKELLEYIRKTPDVGNYSQGLDIPR